MSTVKKVVQKSFKEITLLFGGAGGAVPFIEMKGLIESMVDQAEAGDDGAKKVLAVVVQFAGLCKVAAKRVGVKL